MDPKSLSTVQDEVFADKALWPQEEGKDEETFCNIASLHVANGVGCHAFDPPPGEEPLLADQIYELMRKSPVFTQMGMAAVQDKVNEGALVFAILPSWTLHQGDGHICTITPGPGDYSGRWNSFTPLCMNLGRSGTCFRSKGVNWAFQMIPEFYAWKEPSASPS